MEAPHYKTPRLYYPQGLTIDRVVRLEGNAHHYLRNVMRKDEGDFIRLFNAESGEFLSVLSAPKKKYVEVTITEQLRPAYDNHSDRPKLTLACPILPKDRMDMLIEKAVELGVHAIQPLIFEHSSVRKIKEERIVAQIIEAAEQCERLDIPALHKTASFEAFLRQHDPNTRLFVALERSDSDPLAKAFSMARNVDHICFMIGPEGGFAEAEREMMPKRQTIKVVSLGPRVLRAETAVFYGLSVIQAALTA